MIFIDILVPGPHSIYIPHARKTVVQTRRKADRNHLDEYTNINGYFRRDRKSSTSVFDEFRPFLFSSDADTGATHITCYINRCPGNWFL